MKVLENFDIELPWSVHDLSAAFKAAGHQLFVVGGAVRDACMGVFPKDIDLATDAHPEKVNDIVVNMGWKSDLTGRAFGVIRAKSPRHAYISEFEIATFREDLTSGRHPSVRFATIDEDALRRDLTINALFYDIASRRIIDNVGGIQDIENRVIRTVGCPIDRFKEDRLRIMRVFRFAGRLGWTVEAETLQAIYENNHLDDVSPERIRDEFVRSIASAQSVGRYLSMLDHAGMWKHIFPGLTVSYRDVESRCVPVVLGIFLDENSSSIVGNTLSSLKYSASEITCTQFLHKFRDMTVNDGYKLWKLFASMRRSSTLMTIDDVIEYSMLRGMPNNALRAAFIDYSPAFFGSDLLSEGYEGKALGIELTNRETLRFEQLYDRHRS